LSFHTYLNPSKRFYTELLNVFKIEEDIEVDDRYLYYTNYIKRLQIMRRK